MNRSDDPYFLLGEFPLPDPVSGYDYYPLAFMEGVSGHRVEPSDFRFQDRDYNLDVACEPDRRLAERSPGVSRAGASGVDQDESDPEVGLTREPAASPHRTIGQSGRINPAVALYFYHVDHLGTPRVITDVNGQPVSIHKYLPFGEGLSPPPSTNTHEFTGHERDAETGLD